MSFIKRVSGHYYTIAPFLEHKLRPLSVPPKRAFRTTVQDKKRGELPVTGWLSQQPTQRNLLVAVHGLGGDADSHYVRRAARAAHAANLACLRINLRGADRSGVDFYHAGLTAELEAAFERLTPEFDNIYLLGYSLGGHVSLTFGLRRPEKLRAVAALCSPLDLGRSARSFDKPARYPYRRHILQGLKEMYRALPKELQSNLSAGEAERINSLVEWDHRIVAPRYGFRSAEHYYQTTSVGPRLDSLEIPALYASTELDPMVLARDVQPSLQASTKLAARWYSRGGHVGFPGHGRHLDDGSEIEGELIRWLMKQ